MLRDYILSVYESVDITLENVGALEQPIYADGMLPFAFSDLVIYSDSGYTTPLNPSAYESIKIDDRVTTKEDGTGGSKKTVYSSFRVLDPSSQTGLIYLRFNNFGAYTSGKLEGQDYIVLDDADYAFTIEPTIKETFLDCSNFTANRTITFTQGEGANIRNKVTILNPSAYRAILTDSTNINWCEPGEQYQIYFNQDTFTRSVGWGVVYNNDSNTSSIPIANILGGRAIGDWFRFLGGSSANIDLSYTSELTIKFLTDSQYSAEMTTAASRFYVNATVFNNEESTLDIKKIWKYYKGF